MSLGPQCGACRQRRVRCDSARPGCIKCAQKGIQCPGYSTSRGLRWRHYVSGGEPQQESTLVLQKAPGLGSLCARADDVAPWNVISYNLDYYNSRIAPDLAACDTGKFRVMPDAWLSLGLVERHLRLCVVSLHKAVQQIADEQWKSTPPQTLRKHANQEMILFHHHQACAARILQHQINQLDDKEPADALLAGTVMFLSSQIQESAYGSWHAHLSGACIMLDRRMRSTTELSSGHEKLFCFHLMVVDVFRTTTSATHLFSPSTMTQHYLYVQRMRHLNFDSRASLTPVPDDVFLATIAINVVRAGRATSPLSIGTFQETTTSPAAILAALQSFCAWSWSRSNSAHDAAASNQEGWRLLAECFRAAAILYLILNTTALDGEDWHQTRGETYHVLVASIRELFDRKRSGGKHHQFILWPIVVAGIEATARGDGDALGYLVSNLKALTTDLGTMAMREAACFLEDIWNDCTRKPRDSKGYAYIDWDHIFEAGPVFLL